MKDAKPHPFAKAKPGEKKPNPFAKGAKAPPFGKGGKPTGNPFGKKK